MDEAREILKSTFGYDSFKPAQEEVIKRLVEENKNALLLLPTGGGKSLCFQIPALCFEGLTLVISPLMSLMKDQVEVLRKKGVKAANLDSSLDVSEAVAVKQGVRSGDLKILYVAPERLNNESFLEMMRHVRISLLAVDEAHCISQWGASFRPEYLKVARFAKELAVERVLCVTATATPGVARDICTSFEIDYDHGLFKAPVYRSNLSFQVAAPKNKAEKLTMMLGLLKKRTGPAIVYVTLQQQATDLAAELRKHGVPANAYHAGLSNETRASVQDSFMASDDAVVVATIAFGMGIDKANIRQIIHYHLPKTLENFSQEVGRAGRDGAPSTCLVMLAAEDIPTLEGFTRADTVSKDSLEKWFEEVATCSPAYDGTLDFYLYDQQKLYDIKINQLNICFAYLELDYELLRAITPCYTVYEISFRNESMKQDLLKDKSEEAETIRKHWKTKKSCWEVDVVATAEKSGVERHRLAKKIALWEMDGLITSKGSKVRNRFMITKELPKDGETRREIAARLHQSIVQREEEAVRKLYEVVSFANSSECLAKVLATHFGDPEAVPNDRCQTCSYCTRGKSLGFDSSFSAVPDSEKVTAILEACPTRDDPRLLARFAFGITSPRLTAAKLTKHPLFGSMCITDFRSLMDVFTLACEEADYAIVEIPTFSEKASAPVAGKKRARSPVAANRGVHSNSREIGSNKRGRYL